MNSAPTFVSLFSGCGGLDLGFIQAGFKCVSAFDSDVRAVENHKHNLKGDIHHCDLLQPVDTYASSISTPDVVLSGSPCQGFSTMGKRDLGDVRNRLLLRGAEIAVSLRPKVFVSENVPAAQFGQHKSYWDELRAFLTRHGYSCTTLTLTASDFGVAQLRQRLFLVATRTGTDFAWSTLPKKSPRLIDAIGDLTGHIEIANHNPKSLQKGEADHLIARKIKPGQKLCNVRGGPRAVPTWSIPEVFGTTTAKERTVLAAVAKIRRRERVRDFGDADPVSLNSLLSEVGWNPDREIRSLLRKSYLKPVGEKVDFRHTFNGKYRRLVWEDLSFTVDTRFGSARNFLHPSKDRALTVREAARIQGFPDSFEFIGPLQDQFRMVGNAVPPPMAKSLAKQLVQFLRETK